MEFVQDRSSQRTAYIRVNKVIRGDCQVIKARP